MVTRLLLASGSLLSFALTACGGGGGSASPVVPRQSSGKTTAVISIKWPVPGAASSANRRHPDYLSDGTESVTILVNGTTTEVDNPNVTPGGTTAPTQTTSQISIAVAPSTSPTTFTVNAYDGLGASGHLLGSGTTSATIVQDTANAVNVTLNGNLGSVVCQAVGPYDKATATANAFTQVGTSGALQLIGKDPDGYTIVMPGTLPALSLTANTPSAASTSPTSTTNQFNTVVTPTGTAEAFTASGTDLNGVSHTATCTITRDLALYVSNVGKPNVAGQQSITIYDATTLAAATGTTAEVPTAVITAPTGQSGTSSDNTDVVEPQFLAVDANGYLFVTNQGPRPGVAYGPTAGYVAIYAPGTGQSGNATPIGLIPNLNRPEGIAFDSTGKLYVLTVDRILEYPATANGETATAVASTTITGSNTDLNSCYGLHVDSAFKIYTACSDVINIFAAGATGNATPTLIELPLTTSMTFDSVSWLDVAPDSTLAFYAPAANNNVGLANDVYVFPAGATNGDTATQAIGTGFSQPTGIAIDPNDGIYVANYGNSSVEYFSSSTILDTGLATATISGAATDLNYPFGVTVR